MYKFTKNLSCLLLLLFVFSACRKKAYDDFYGRPAGLAQPIYQVLQARGNFTNLLACIDKAGYTSTLSTGGYWTMFAPNDDAFKKFFAANNISNISQISVAMATQIVTYSLAYNASFTDHISDFQSTIGYVPNQAFKRRTAFHESFYKDTVKYTPAGKTDPLAGQVINTISTNRNAGYIYGDFNDKYIPYFTDAYLTTNGLSATDYLYFYPGSTYSGFNVVAGAVVNKDIPAENGVIHEVNSVTLPLKNIEESLTSNANYSHFKQLLDKYFVLYTQDATLTHLYQVQSVTSGTNAYYKSYYNATNPIGFSLNNENFLKLQDNDSQVNGYTLFAPNNTAFDAFVKTVLLEHYPSLDKLPLAVIQDFVNAHMYQSIVWPSKFATTANIAGEPARFNTATDIVDKYMGSNGVFYGTNKVQQANAFTTVFVRPYLDPNYTLMTTALNTGLRYIISNPANKFTLFMVSDATFRALGYDYSNSYNAFTYTAPGAATVIGGTANTNFYRIINMLIAKTPNGELDNLTGQGIFESGPGDGTGGEYLKYNNNRVFAAGNVDNGTSLKIDSTKTNTNGRVYYTSTTIPQFTLNNVGYHISLSATTPTSPYYNFYKYLSSSSVYTAATYSIAGVQPGVYYTILVPSNAAILQAVKDGYLPGTVVGAVVTPNFTPTAQSDINLVANFIQYHIIKGTTIVPDGKKFGPPSFPTLLVDANSGNPDLVQVANAPNVMKVSDNKGRTSNVVVANSNVLSNFTVIHQIDNYLAY